MEIALAATIVVVLGVAAISRWRKGRGGALITVSSDDFWRMKRLPPLVAVALWFGILSCQPAVHAPQETMLREAYLFLNTSGADTLSYSEFIDQVNSDTAATRQLARIWKSTRVIMSATLGRLGYGTGPFRWEYGAQETEALERFQRDLGVAVTGRLDSITVSHLARAGSAFEVNDIVLPQLFVMKIGQWFVASGTWKATTNKLAYPVNSVDIVCDTQRGECSVVVVDFISETLDQITMNRYDLVVTHHTDDVLIARAGDRASRITLTINVPAEDVSWVQVNPDQKEDLFGQPREAEQMTLRLVSGFLLSPPFDGGDLREVHEDLFSDKDRYLALFRKNLLFDETEP